MDVILDTIVCAVAETAEKSDPGTVRPDIQPSAIGEHPTKKKPTLPDPPRFNGLRKKFRAWELEMRSKLRVDGTAIGSPADRFAYIYARLEETPQAMAAVFFFKGWPRWNLRSRPVPHLLRKLLW